MARHYVCIGMWSDIQIAFNKINEGAALYV